MTHFLKVKDKSDSFFTHKPNLPSVPFRMVILGKSLLSGKSSSMVNLLIRPEFYGGDFQGENMYLVSPSLATDQKLQHLVKYKEIPDTNLMEEYDEEVLETLYKNLEEQYKDEVADGEKKPANKILVLDDCSFSGALKAKMNGIINKVAMNGRHINLSLLITAQKYTDVSTGIRENLSCLIAFDMSQKQLELVAADHNFFHSKKMFFKLFHDHIKERHDFIVVNYSAKDKASRYMDKTFDVIDISKYEN